TLQSPQLQPIASSFTAHLEGTGTMRSMETRDLSADEQAMVDFLLVYERALPPKPALGDWTSEEHEAFLSSGDADALGEAWSAYADLGAARLTSAYQDARNRFAVDQERIFKPLTDLGIQQWQRLDAWSLEQAAALSIGCEPREGLVAWVN